MPGWSKYPPELRTRAKILWMSGNYKSDKEIARELGIQRPNTVAEWRKRDNWYLERQEAVSQQSKRNVSVLAETMVEMQRRHLREYQALQTKGVQALSKHDARTVGEAVQLIDTGVKGERLVRGEATEIREIRGVLEINVQILEDIVAEIIRDFLHERRLKREDARAFAEQFAERVSRAPFRFQMEGGT